MNKFLLFFLLGFFALPASATNAVFITQSGAGSVNGTSCGNAQTAAYFNSGGNWSGTPTGIQIGPDTTVHVCSGAITSSLIFQGSGTSGHPIILFFETGGRISQTFCSQGGTNACLDIGGKSWLIIDGGVACGIDGSGNTISEATCNGKIEATANGTGLANQQTDVGGIGSGIWAPGASNIEFKNMDLRNVYIHSGTDNVPIGSNGNGGIFTNGTESNWHIHDGKIHDTLWALHFDSCSAAMTNIEIDHMDIYNSDHGVAFGIGNQTDTGILVHDNRIHDPANWDTPTNDYHHDGIHWFDGACGLNAGSITGMVYNNTFDGDWGTHATGFTFYEGHIFVTEFNNLFRQPAGTARLANGIFNNCNNAGGRSLKFYNNTGIFLNADTSSPLETCGTIDVRNNVILVTMTNNAMLAQNQGGSGTFDYNAYANNNPGTQLFTNTGSCCQLTYAQWKATNGFDSHSTAILATPIGLNTTTGVPNGGSPVIGAGINLSSLGIAALNSDKNGNARPGGAWTIGAFNFGSNPPATPTGIKAVWF